MNSERKKSSQTELILTAAVPHLPDANTASFPVDSMRDNFNWVHIMAYNYYVPKRSNVTGAFAALYDPASEANTDYGIGAWIGRGLSAEKLVLGLPFYGYAWTLKNPNNNAIGALATGTAITPDGSMSYKAIKAYIQKNGADVRYNATYVVKFFTVGSDWACFDDVDVVKSKVSYAKQKKLLGYYVWQVSHDDNWELSLAGKRCSSL